MGFSAMLAEEYIINCINFTQQRFGLKNHGISAQQKALDVVRKKNNKKSCLYIQQDFFP
jgi:hypothetical protein